MTPGVEERFARQLSLAGVGAAGQEKLRAGRVLVIGTGGLGSPAILYLAAAGVGTLGICDNDKVELSNLQRQIIHDTEKLGQVKTASARDQVRKLNPGVDVCLYEERFTRENAGSILTDRDWDFVLDCTDNFTAKFLINDTCFFHKKPYSHAGVQGFEGQTFTYLPVSTCYRCIFKEPPDETAFPSAREAGVMGVTPGVVGTLQAAEALKYLLGIGETLTSSLLIVDLLKMEFRKIAIRRNQECPLCGEKPAITSL